jgi:hypothetical protein
MRSKKTLTKELNEFGFQHAKINKGKRKLNLYYTVQTILVHIKTVNPWRNSAGINISRLTCRDAIL